jgi:hypothetical protein
MVTGIESAIAASALARQDMQTEQKAAVCSDFGSHAGVAVGLAAQLSAFSGFAAERQAA